MRLECALFHFFLARNAITRPRNSFEAFLLEFLMARDALAKTVFADAIESIVDQLKERAIVVRLTEEELFSVGVGGLVSQIDGRIFVGFAAFLLSTCNNAKKLIAARSQFLLVVVETFLVHARHPQTGHLARPKPAILPGRPIIVNASNVVG